MTEIKSDVFQNVLLVLATIVAIYPFLLNLEKIWKVIAIISGGIVIWYYLQYLFREWIAEEVLTSDKMEKIKSGIKKEHIKLKEEISYIRGWMDAINHFYKNKKGKKKGIDPITLIVIVIVIILIILVLKGKL